MVGGRDPVVFQLPTALRVYMLAGVCFFAVVSLAMFVLYLAGQATGTPFAPIPIIIVLSVVYRIITVRVVLEEDRLVVRNPFRTFTLAAGDVDAVVVGDAGWGARRVGVTLTDGRLIWASGARGTRWSNDAERAARAIEQWLAERRGRPLPGP